MTSSSSKTEYSLPMLRTLLRGELEVDGEKKIYDDFGILITSISITNKTLYTNLIEDLTHTANIGKGIKQNGAAIAALTAAKKLESLTSFTVEEKKLLVEQDTLTSLLRLNLTPADEADIKNKLREIEQRLIVLQGTKSRAEIELAIQHNQKVTEKDAGLIEGAKIEAKAAIKYALENYVTPKAAADKPATLSTKDLASKTPKKTKTVTGKLDSYQAKDTVLKPTEKTKTFQKQAVDQDISKQEQYNDELSMFQMGITSLSKKIIPIAQKLAEEQIDSTSEIQSSDDSDNSDDSDYFDRARRSQSPSFSKKEYSQASASTPSFDSKKTGIASTMRKAFGLGKKDKVASLQTIPDKISTSSHPKIPSEFANLNLTEKEKVELQRLLGKRAIDKKNAEKNMHAWRCWGTMLIDISRLGTDLEAVDKEKPVGKTHKEQLFHKYCRVCTCWDSQKQIQPSSLAKLEGMFNYTYDTDASFRTLPLFRGHFASDYKNSGDWKDFNKYKLNRRNDPDTKKPKNWEDADNRYIDFDEWVNRVIIPYPKHLETSVLTKAEQQALQNKLAGTSFFSLAQDAPAENQPTKKTQSVDADSMILTSTSRGADNSGLEAYYAIAHKGLSAQESQRRKAIDRKHYQKYWQHLKEWAGEMPIVSRRGTDLEAIGKNIPKDLIGRDRFWYAFRECFCRLGDSRAEIKPLVEKYVRPLAEMYLDEHPEILNAENMIFTDGKSIGLFYMGGAVSDWNKWNKKMLRSQRGDLAMNEYLSRDFLHWFNATFNQY